MEIEDKNKFKDREIYEIVNRAKKGDQSAYSEIHERYYKSVYYMVLRMVKNEADAEDITMEVFTKVFASLDMYAEIHSFSTWLFKIASNHAIDFLRKRKNSQNMLKLDEPLDEETNWFFELASDEPNPERHLMIKQHEEELRKIISYLPDDLKVVLKMRVFEDLSYKEIAEKLDVTIGTVKTRLFRARNILATILKRDRK